MAGVVRLVGLAVLALAAWRLPAAAWQQPCPRPEGGSLRGSPQRGASPLPEAGQAPEEPQPQSVLAKALLGLSALLLGVVLSAPPPVLADSKSLSTVAPCLVSKCQLPLAKCILNPNCAANLTCIIGCSGQKDEKSCQIKCGDNFENDVVGEFNACALSSKKCVPQRPDVGPMPGTERWDPVNGRYPVPPADSIVQDFAVEKMTGAWFITAGLNPLFDTFPCQAHFFEGMAPSGTTPGKLLGKIGWRVEEPDGEFLTKSTVQSFVQTSPGVLENHNNEYLHYQDDWYILDHGFEDDPELGFILVYYRGQNDAWAGYGGGTLYTRKKTIPPEVIDKVVEATARANVPFYKFWTITDNTCPAGGDPAELRKMFAQRLAKQAAQSAEVQFTYLARSAYSEVDKDEKYLLDGAKRIYKSTKRFTKKLKRNEDRIEEAIEAFEKAAEQPALKILQFLFKR